MFVILYCMYLVRQARAISVDPDLAILDTTVGSKLYLFKF